jgi:predicted DNA-binding protein
MAMRIQIKLYDETGRRVVTQSAVLKASSLDEIKIAIEAWLAEMEDAVAFDRHGKPIAWSKP